MFNLYKSTNKIILLILVICYNYLIAQTRQSDSPHAKVEQSITPEVEKLLSAYSAYIVGFELLAVGM